jgi:hypothetical protein
LLPLSDEQYKAVVRLRMTEEASFKLVVQWLEESLKDQTLTNEAMFDTNKLFNGQGRSACIREIVQALAR